MLGKIKYAVKGGLSGMVEFGNYPVNMRGYSPPSFSLSRITLLFSIFPSLIWNLNII